MARVLLDAEALLGKLHFSLMGTTAQFVPAEVTFDFDVPQREAAFFYGLFLRGQARFQAAFLSPEITDERQGY